jgi:hypothetical protein
MSSSATSAINVSFNDAEFRFALETVLAGCHRHAADIGEVVMTACRITAVWSAAAQAEQAGRRRAALTYYAARASSS